MLEETKYPRLSEADLYVPVSGALTRGWIPQEDLRDFVVEITANQGSRSTGGLWTRPDISILGVTCHPYIPGRNLDITTFEIKKSIGEGIYGVFEAAAHSAFSNRSFLILKVEDEEVAQYQDLFDRTKSECERFGIGLIVFSDPQHWSSYQVLIQAEFRSPNPGQANKFIESQISEENRHRLLTMFR